MLIRKVSLSQVWRRHCLGWGCIPPEAAVLVDMRSLSLSPNRRYYDLSLSLIVREGQATGEWVLDGTKAWISNSAEAGLFVVFANADFAKGHKGITAFIVERSEPPVWVWVLPVPHRKMAPRSTTNCGQHLSS
jgi:hypothetical protein